MTAAGNYKCTGCPDPDDNNGETTLSVASTNSTNCTCSEGFSRDCKSQTCLRWVNNIIISRLESYFTITIITMFLTRNLCCASEMMFEHARTGASRMSFISSPRVPPVQAMEDATALQGWTARQTTTRPTTARAEARAVKLVRKVARAKTMRLPQSSLEAFGPQCHRQSMARPL